jgi:hypothetical protein
MHPGVAGVQHNNTFRYHQHFAALAMGHGDIAGR